MTPSFLITANGTDITGRITDYLLGIEIADEAEDKSDRITLQLDDRARGDDNAVLEIPLIGTVISIALGYKESGLRDMGTYLIDEISVDSPPRTLTVTGRAAAMNTSYRTPRNQSWHQQTLGSIMAEIASRNGYDARTDPALSGIVVRHADQCNESDMAFAARLADDYDAVAKPVEGRLVTAKRGTGTAITGDMLPPVIINETMCASWRFQYSARDEVGEATGLDATGGSDQQAAADSRSPENINEGEGIIHYPRSLSRVPRSTPHSFHSLSGLRPSTPLVEPDPPLGQPRKQKDPLSPGPAPGEKGGVRAWWTDIRTGEKKSVTVGKEPYHDMRYTYHNEAEAKASISSYRNKSLRGKASFSCETGGNPLAQSEARLEMQPAFRPYIPPVWRIKNVKHRFERSGGYMTALEYELFDDSQERQPNQTVN